MVKYTAGSLMLWACSSARCPEHIVTMHGIMDSIKYQQIKNQNLTASVRNLIMGHVWIFQQDNNPKQTSKSTQKWVTEHKMNLLPWLSQLLWPEPYRKWVNWREEVLAWSGSSEGSGEILYEENGLRSLISCSPNSSGIIGENSGLLPWEKDD